MRSRKALEEVLREGAELVIVFGASAIADRRDVIPAAVEAIGGAGRAFRHAGRSRQSAAARRRPRPAGARRAGLCALAEGKRIRLGSDAPAGRARGAARGHHRPGRRRPADGDRDAAAAARRSRSSPTDHRIAAIVLAAGRSTRMGGPNKLLAEIGGKPLVRIAAEQALASRAAPVIVVTGHERERVERGACRACRCSSCTIPILPPASARSLKAGIAAVPAEADGADRLPRRHAAGRRRA